MFELAQPWALLLWFLPFVIWYLLPRAPDALPAAVKVPFFDAVAHFVIQKQGLKASASLLLLPAAIWFCLVIALAGPRWVGEPRPVVREGYNIMMVMDLSQSMELPDMLLHGRPASRLVVVKRAAEQFVNARVGDKIGLILFGTRAYLQTPLTYDRRSILLRLQDATAGLAGKTTSIGDALGLAVKRLKPVPKEGRVIILLTDGANNSGVLSPMQAADIAKDDGIKVYTIGLGSEADSRALTSNFLIQNASSDLDEDTLKQIAKRTGGHYFRATDSESLQEIYHKINALEHTTQEQATVRPQVDYYPWFVALAFALGMFWLLRHSPLLPVRRFKAVPSEGAAL